MVSLRLSYDFENKLNQISKIEHLTKTEIIKNALNVYFADYFQNKSAYEYGKDLFGKYGSKEHDRSQKYKESLRIKLNEKHSH